MVCVVVGDIKPAVGQIAEARRKPEPQEVAEPEYVLGRAAGIGIVLSDDEGAFMVEEAIQNMGRLACVSCRTVLKSRPVKTWGPVDGRGYAMFGRIFPLWP